MRKVDRNVSPQFRLGKSSSNDIAHPRIEPFSKTFKKKYQAFEPASISSTTNLIKTFAKSRRTDRKSPAQKETSPNRTAERRSSSKNNLQRHVERLSLNSQAYQQQNGLSTSSKLIIINNIFSRKSFGNGPKELLEKVYDHNEEYLDLLCEWQKLEIYDEIDKLVYKLTQNYLKLIEDLFQKTYQHFNTTLQHYEAAVAQLAAENEQLRQENCSMRERAGVLENLEDKLVEQYHRNQWSTLILTEIAKQQFDLESFVKTLPVFTKMHALNPTLSASALPKDHHQSVFAQHAHAPLKPKNIKSAGQLSELEQIVRNRQQQAQFSLK